MFSFLRKKPQGITAQFAITGMHCTSCSANIDLTLEDMDGVLESATSYAKGTTAVTYDEKKISPEQLKQTIAELGYQAQLR